MSASHPPIARLRRFSGALEDLAERSLVLWLEVGLDPRGGAHGFLDRHFQPVMDDEGVVLGPSQERRGDQGLVQQSRHLYSYCLAYQHGVEKERSASFAHELSRYLGDGFSRGEGRRSSGSPGTQEPMTVGSRCSRAVRGDVQPFLHWVPRGGALLGQKQLLAELDKEGRGPYRLPEPGEEFLEQSPQSPFTVQLYAQGFSIYALATYGLTFDAVGEAERARELFCLLDERRHDDEFGGYEQTNDGGWLQFVGAPDGAAKCTNTHIHLLEALTPLCRCFPDDELIRSRLKELSRLIVEVLQQPSGYVHKFFARDGSPLGEPRVSYGHDLETSWLLLDALDALRNAGCLDSETETVVTAGSQKMAFHALRTGWDPVGGIFDEGIPEGAAAAPLVTNHEKVWWAQAEALPGLFKLYQQVRDLEILDRLEETFAFLSEKSWDAEAGEFFWGVDSEGKVGARGNHKGEMWKTPYHSLRALLLTKKWVDEFIEEAEQAPQRVRISGE